MSLRGHNFLTAGQLIGVNTLGERIALREEIPHENTLYQQVLTQDLSGVRTLAELDQTDEREADIVRRILAEGGHFLEAGELSGNTYHNLRSSELPQSMLESQFAPLTQDLSGANVDSEFRIVFDVKEALEKYRDMKAEVATLKERHKELEKKERDSYEVFRELKQNYGKLTDFLLPLETRQKYLEYEKALYEHLGTTRIGYSKEISENYIKYDKLKKKIAEITQFIKEGVRGEIPEEDIQRMRDPNLCAICIENKVTHVFNPCGHTVCEGCINPSLTRCHICRKQIMTKIRMYFI